MLAIEKKKSIQIGINQKEDWKSWKERRVSYALNCNSIPSQVSNLPENQIQIPRIDL